MQNNAGLCGAIPDCLVNRVPQLEDTGLMDPRNASANPEGGLCDELPPSCLPEHGCRWAELCCESALHAYSGRGSHLSTLSQPARHDLALQLCLVSPRNASASPEGGLCVKLPPSCLPGHGCRWDKLCHRSWLHACERNPHDFTRSHWHAALEGDMRPVMLSQGHAPPLCHCSQQS